jgi:hypothetical protein
VRDGVGGRGAAGQDGRDEGVDLERRREEGGWGWRVWGRGGAFGPASPRGRQLMLLGTRCAGGGGTRRARRARRGRGANRACGAGGWARSRRA